MIKEMNTQEANATAKQKAQMRLRVYRAETDTWEDGPVVGAVNVGLKRWQDIKLMVLGRLLNLIRRVQSKLEEHKYGK